MIEDQLSLSSCTANAIVGNYELLLKMQYPEKFVDLSRLFVYYNARLIDGTVNEDIGAYLKDGIKALKEYGVCQEKLWPYNINNFAIRPSIESYEDAKFRNIKNYYRLDTLDDMLDALNNNLPVLFGMLVYTTFDGITKENSTLDIDNKPSAGGHAVSLVGYDLSAKKILARNSFGDDWGDGGYFWVTFQYVESEIMDAWVFDIDLAK